MKTKKYQKVAINLLLAIIMIVLVLFVLPKILIYFMPFLVAGIIALIANPLVHFLEGKVKIKRKAGTVVVIILVIGFILLIGYFMITKLVNEAMGFYNDFPKMWESVSKDLEGVQLTWLVFFEKLPLNIQTILNETLNNFSDFGSSILGSMGTPTMEALGNFAKHVPSVIISVIMCLLASYFFIAERDYIIIKFHKYMPEGIQKRWMIMKNSFAQALGGYFKAQLKIELWIYLLLVIGFAILRVDYILLIALGIACLDFLPFFGTGIVLMPWAIIKFLSADYKMTIGLLIIWGAGQLVRQIIQPKIMGDSIGIPPIPTIVLLYVGYRIGGVLGMIASVPLGIIVVDLYKSGMFEVTEKSIRILITGINNYRRIEPEDMEEVYREEEIQRLENEKRMALEMEKRKEKELEQILRYNKKKLAKKSKKGQ